MAALFRDGVRLAYEEAGTGDPSIVFIHGWSGTRWFLHKQAEHFAIGHRVVSLDLRGHGESDAPRQEYTIPGFADDVAWVIRELGLDRPIVAGHSMGGAIALQVGATHADSVRAVVMIDPPALVAGFEPLDLPGAPATESNVARRRAAFVDAKFLPRHNASVRDAVQAELLKTNDFVAVNSGLHSARWDAIAAGRACKVPTLNLSADPGMNVLADVEALIENCVTGKAVGAGHNFQLEIPEQVNSMIAQFIREYLD